MLIHPHLIQKFLLINMTLSNFVNLCIIQIYYSPCDFWLFPKLKYPLKGKIFDDVEEIKRNATRELLAITKNDFQEKNCFRKFHCWQKIIASEGNYFEGDVVHIIPE